MTCPKCAKDIVGNFSFCPHCGNPITPETIRPTETITPAKNNRRKKLILVILGISAIAATIAALFFLTPIKEKNTGQSTKTQEKNTINSQQSVETTERVGLHNNYGLLKGLTWDQEIEFGIFQMPKTGQKVLNYKSIDIYDTQSRRFKDGEVEVLKWIIDRAPAKFLQTPPKAVVSICCEEMAQFGPRGADTAVAYASGPYMLIGNGLFEGGWFSGKNSLDEKVAIFFHEYTHTMQYWYVHEKYIKEKKVSTSELSVQSTLVFDFARYVGWTQDIHSMGNHVETNEGETLKFWKFYSTDWALPEERKKEATSDYAATYPTEDEAESFGFFIAGQPQMLSEKRKEYVSTFLGENPEKFIAGVIPQFPKSERLQFNDENFTKEQRGKLEKSGKKQVDRMQWAVGKSVSFNPVFSFYNGELPKREFSVDEPFISTVLDHKEVYAYGIYSYENKKYLYSILDFTGAVGYSYKPESPIVTVLVYE